LIGLLVRGGLEARAAYGEGGRGYGPALSVPAHRRRGLSRSVGDLLKWRGGRDGMDAFRATTEQSLVDLNNKLDFVVKLLWGTIGTVLTGVVLLIVQIYLATHGVHGAKP
jgi:hypothetical protein